MPKYNVVIPWHCSVLVTVEASSKDEAIDKAERNAFPSLCHQCNGEVELGEQNTEYPSEAENIPEE